MTDPAAIHAVDGAITSRRSIRAFLPTPVAKETIVDILRRPRAPSGTNTQPWKVHVLTGAAWRSWRRIRPPTTTRPSAPRTARNTPTTRPDGGALHRPAPQGRLGPVHAAGHRQDRQARMHAQHGRNYAFFDAPVGLIFTIDRVMQQGSWLDYGMFLQNIMVAARARGLDTCPQAAFTQFHRIIEAQLGPARWWCAACRSATPTRRRSRTRWSPSASRSGVHPVPRSEARGGADPKSARWLAGRSMAVFWGAVRGCCHAAAGWACDAVPPPTRCRWR